MAYLLHPDIRGDKLVFTSEDNLWSCDLDGKNPRLILSNLGTITSPRISPDGTKVAFRSTKGTDTVISEIYVISLKTGDLKRVTYFGTSGTNVVDWQSDSTILAVSDEGSPFMGVVRTPLELVVVYAAISLFASLITVNWFSLIADQTDSTTRGRFLAVINILSSIGTIISLFVMTFLFSGAVTNDLIVMSVLLSMN